MSDYDDWLTYHETGSMEEEPKPPVTSVIHIKNAPPKWKANDQFVYIGRGSKWGNPYHVSMGRTKCIERYRDHISCQLQLMSALHELKGKTLVCFCKPKDCHGDILVAMAEAACPTNNS